MTPHPDATSGRWIPWMFVLGFGVILAVNLALIVAAIRTFPGLDNPAPYDRGLAYNRVLAEATRQDAVGWRLDATLDRASGELVVRATDRDGAPLDGLALAGTFTRPVDSPVSVAVTLRAAGEGVYRAPLALPRAGQWILHLVATAADERVDWRTRLVAR